MRNGFSQAGKHATQMGNTDLWSVVDHGAVEGGARHGALRPVLEARPQSRIDSGG
jgi:hypothetical protein